VIRTRRGAGAVLSLNLVVLVVLVACSGGHPSFPSSLLYATSTTATTYPDYSSVSLGAVAGVTTLTVNLTPGAANINGTVVDDTGAPVPAATIHLERLVGTQLASVDIPAAADGTWKAQGIVGGLYRVRAWRPPDLAIVDPQILFLGATDTQTVNLQLQRFTGDQVTSNIAPSPPIIGQPANLVVLVTVSTVAADGTVHGQGKPGTTVELAGGGSWAVSGNASEVTGADGTARWELTCGALGPQSLSVVVDTTNSFPLSLPPCAPVPTTTTTGTSTTVVSGTTSTTTKHRTG